MSLSETERNAVVSKLRSAEQELFILIIEEEEVADLASDLRAIIDRLERIILRLQSPL
jgi:Glu-tRNA(Gln) amidotransferase subunit E-like FAD-binding protein